jgi:hypothetical protein
LLAAQQQIAALTPKPDPWLDRVARWLAARPNEHRHLTASILHGAIGIPPSMQDVAAQRRLGYFMRMIGIWRPSTNIDGSSKRGRG